MAVNLNQVVSEILDYVRKNGGAYSQWYAGIAATPKKRLFDDHRVLENGIWIHSADCGGSEAAREVEKYLLSIGFDGGDGGGSYDTRFIYAYKKTLSSNP
jgi:hypothetical protein